MEAISQDAGARELDVREPQPALAGEAALLAAMRRGERFAFETLMRQNNRRLYRLARSITRNDSEAEDAVQEGYVRALTHLDGFRGEASLATWLARIVANEALGRVRRRRPTVELDDLRTASGSCEAALVTPPVASPENAAARREIRGLIEQAIDTLPAHFRAVFVLRAVEQMSIEETADLLGIAPATVKTRLHRANKLLRQKLSDRLESILDDVFAFAGLRCDRILRNVLARLHLQ
ncbi:RNA polymerase sigma factor [Dongia soli]|uniref:RNA polymerase sigma factor n=1 Tax=Dongia soli TaxID=600628 RepID=A0ABU5E8D5_9PROT|nr:RNA polymerase sigma factor [Dongia soli]MDY0881870.1 RNA polymerase sigma factor [Dongia soli]